MEKLTTVLKLSHKFAQTFVTDYFKMLIKPFLIGVFGLIFLPLCFVNPIFAVFAGLITIPAVCWAFWQGFCITHLLNYAALNYLKKTPELQLKDYLKSFLQNEKDFARYVSFCVFMCVLFYSPIIYIIVKKIPNLSIFNLSGIINIFSSMLGIFVLFLVITVLLMPFTNFFTQAYFFKKPGENYFNLFFNCYKYLDKTGVVLAFSITSLSVIISSLNIVFLPLLVILNLYYYSINTFWYYAKTLTTEEKAKLFLTKAP